MQEMRGMRDFERSFYADAKIESARFFRKDLVEKIGGCEKDVMFYEEGILPQKIENLSFDVKAKIGAEILHNGNNFLLNWLKRKIHDGKAAQRYKEKYQECGKKQMSIFYRFGIFLKNRRFYSEPLLALGVLILKSLEYVSAGLGYLVGNVRR